MRNQPHSSDNQSEWSQPQATHTFDSPVECHAHGHGSSSSFATQHLRDSVTTVRVEEHQATALEIQTNQCGHGHSCFHGYSGAQSVHETDLSSSSTHSASSSSSCRHHHHHHHHHHHSHGHQTHHWQDSDGEDNEEDNFDDDAEIIDEDMDENISEVSEEDESEEEMDDDIEVDDDEDEESQEDGDSNSDSRSQVSQKSPGIDEDRQKELRKQIIQIQSDSSIPASEKAKRIQELMTKGWTSKQQKERSKEVKHVNRLVNKKSDFSIVTAEDKAPTFHSPGILGCKHYQRACKLQAHCCGKWDTCRFCHDEVSDHTITRNLITTMMCMYCSTVQEAGQDCINPACGKRVAKYYCKDCKLWDDDPRKNIYHCHDCGICRIGKGLGIDYFHCKVCNVCMAIGLKGRHKCIERNLESDCPICGEYMFTSTSTVIFMPCGHCMHHKCHQQYIQTSYQCPTCLKSLADMSDYFRRIDIALTQHRMPPEYDNHYSHVYCNDCEKKSHARFHFIYHKCGHCRGYNTKLLSTRLGLPEGAIIAPEVTTAVIQPTTAGTPLAHAELSRQSSASDQIQTVERMGTVHATVSENHEVTVASSSRHSATSSNQQTAQRSVFEYQYSSSSVASSSQSGGLPGSYWCHQCQLPTDILVSEVGRLCAVCSSDFVEEM